MRRRYSSNGTADILADLPSSSKFFCVISYPRLGSIVTAPTVSASPSFTNSAAPDVARSLFDYFVAQARAAHPIVQTGRFATEMAVELVNDGPITIPMRVAPMPSDPH